MENQSVFTEVDARTTLAGANRLEVLLFNLGSKETYGINVFKVREVLHIPELTHVPSPRPHIAGMVSLRGNVVPVLNLISFCGGTATPSVMIVTEYNRHTQGFLVGNVENIVRLEWSEVKEPPDMMAGADGLVTAVTHLKDGRLATILDVEKVMADVLEYDVEEGTLNTVEPVAVEGVVFFADDSKVARVQLEKTLQKMGVGYQFAINGAEAWQKLDALARDAESSGVPLMKRLALIITDIEMPEMDGYVLTKKIKADRRFAGIPVVMHTSLSGNANRDHGDSVGADGFISKFNAAELAHLLSNHLSGPGLANVH